MFSKKFMLRSVLLTLTFAAVSLQPIVTRAWGDAALKLEWQTKFVGDSVMISPGDIAIDAWGNVFASNQAANNVKKFDGEGNFVAQFGSAGKGEGKFNLALGIAIDSDNNVYVGDFYNRLIQKFDNNGNFLAQWENESSTNPAFFAIDSKDNLYVNEFPPHDTHFVQKFDVKGTLISEWGNVEKTFSGRTEDIAVDKDGNLYVTDPIGHRVQKQSPDGKWLATFGGEMSKAGNGLFDAPFGISVDSENNVYILDTGFLQKLDADGKFIAQWSTKDKGSDLEAATNVAVDAHDNVYVFAKADVTNVNGDKAHVPILKKFSQP